MGRSFSRPSRLVLWHAWHVPAVIALWFTGSALAGQETVEALKKQLGEMQQANERVDAGASRTLETQEGRGRTCDLGGAVREGDPGESFDSESVHRHGHRHRPFENRERRTTESSRLRSAWNWDCRPRDRSVTQGPIRVHHRNGRGRRDRRSGRAVTTALPVNVTAGRFFADFGRLTQFHQHELPFVNTPLSMEPSWSGGESLGTGHPVAAYLFPTPFYLSLTGGVFNEIGHVPRAQRMKGTGMKRRVSTITRKAKDDHDHEGEDDHDHEGEDDHDEDDHEGEHDHDEEGEVHADAVGSRSLRNLTYLGSAACLLRTERNLESRGGFASSGLQTPGWTLRTGEERPTLARGALT